MPQLEHVLDGWWEEGFNGHNGWTIGQDREYPDEAAQDAADALSLYDTLENVIVPLFYDRGTGWHPARLAGEGARLDQRRWRPSTAWPAC